MQKGETQTFVLAITKNQFSKTDGKRKSIME